MGRDKQRSRGTRTHVSHCESVRREQQKHYARRRPVNLLTSAVVVLVVSSHHMHVTRSPDSFAQIQGISSQKIKSLKADSMQTH